MVRLGVMQGEFHWHKHDEQDEFFFVLDGLFRIELDSMDTVEPGPRQAYLVPRGLLHRPVVPIRSSVLMLEQAGVTATGDRRITQSTNEGFERMTRIGPQPGLKHTSRLLVDDGLIVPAVSDTLPGFTGMPRVFATAYLIAFVENACIEAVAPLLPEGSKTVGTHVELSHSAATPVGMEVTAFVELVEVEGRRLRFAVECRDEQDVISSGHHERHVIDASKFDQRMAAKAATAATAP